MASIKKITELLAAIRTSYPYYAKETDVVHIGRIWKRMLENYDDRELESAFYLCLRTCKTPPSIADIIENLENLRGMNMPSAEESWNEYVKKLSEASRLVTCFNYTAIDHNGKSQGDNAREKCRVLWDEMDEELRRYTGGYGEFVRKAYEYAMGESVKYEHERFLKTFARIRKVSMLESHALYLPSRDAPLSLSE